MPQSSTDRDWLLIYDAEYHLLPVSKALGYATMALDREYTVYMPIVVDNAVKQ